MRRVPEALTGRNQRVRLGLFGGAFDPPHVGHVALVRAAKQAFGLDRVVVVVVAAPGHKQVETPAGIRLAMARAAFPDDEVVLDEHTRTVDMLRAHPEWEGATFLMGADELASFGDWKEPDEVLRLVRLGVATRPGHAVELADPERIAYFELAEPASSHGVRERLERGEDARDVIPAAVWGMIEREGLYGRRPSYTRTA
jgi:nicotinate-nucleotide adenylyltransferase